MDWGSLYLTGGFVTFILCIYSAYHIRHYETVTGFWYSTIASLVWPVTWAYLFYKIFFERKEE